MIGGYTGRILRINLSNGSIATKKTDITTAYNFLGGRGYAAKILYDELRPGIDPLGPKNKLI